MDKLDTARLVKLMAGAWPDLKISEDTISAWAWLLKNEDFNLACAAVSSLAHTRSDSFIPKIQDLIREMKKLVLPKLFLTYEEAEIRGSAILKRAKEQVYGKPKPYNAYGNPKELEYNAYTSSAQERAVRLTYEALRTTMEQRPVHEIKLISCGRKACLEAGREDLAGLFSPRNNCYPMLPASVMQRI